MLTSPAERFPAVGFDLDGTLIDTAPDLGKAANAMLDAMGATPLPETRIRALIGNGIEHLVEGAVTASLGRKPGKAALVAAVESFRNLYTQHLFDRGRVYPGVREGLESLHSNGVRLCCITNKAAAFTLPLLAAAALGKFFAFVLCAERPEQRKPSATLLREACERFGVPARSMLYVGDSSVDILAARAAGCPVMTVSYGYGSAFPPPSPDRMLDGFAELAPLCARPRPAPAV
jgi:phosphoglycolate phosphatase